MSLMPNKPEKISGRMRLTYPIKLTLNIMPCK